MSDVFISYKRERRAAAEHLAEILAAYGFDVWYDYDLVKGLDFADQIERRINGAKALVVLWCTRSTRSRWVREEVDLARERGILIPVKIEPCDAPIGYRLADTIDLSSWDGAPRSHSIDPLIDALEQRVGTRANQDRHRLRDYEAAWRRFGAPTLSRFALTAAVAEGNAPAAEATAEGDAPISEPAKHDTPVAEAGKPEAPAAEPADKKPQLRAPFPATIPVSPELARTVFRDAPGAPLLNPVRPGEGKLRPFAVSELIALPDWEEFARRNENVRSQVHKGRIAWVTPKTISRYLLYLAEMTGKTYRLPSKTEWDYCVEHQTIVPQPDSIEWVDAPPAVGIFSKTDGERSILSREHLERPSRYGMRSSVAKYNRLCFRVIRDL